MNTTLFVDEFKIKEVRIKLPPTPPKNSKGGEEAKTTLPSPKYVPPSLQRSGVNGGIRAFEMV
jgi:hypothetical protein